jgi:hypothetical protein
MTGYKRYFALALIGLASAIFAFIVLCSMNPMVLASLPPSQGLIVALAAFQALVLCTGAMRVETDDLHKRVMRLEAELARRVQP